MAAHPVPGLLLKEKIQEQEDGGGSHRIKNVDFTL